jgi:hypothetical protein
MTDRIGAAAICLHISSAIYLIAGLALMGYSLPSAQPTRLPLGSDGRWALSAWHLRLASGDEVREDTAHKIGRKPIE